MFFYFYYISQLTTNPSLCLGGWERRSLTGEAPSIGWTPTTNLQSVVEAAGQIDAPAAEAGMGYEVAPPVEPETTAKTPVHPQDQNVGIPP